MRASPPLPQVNRLWPLLTHELGGVLPSFLDAERGDPVSRFAEFVNMLLTEGDLPLLATEDTTIRNPKTGFPEWPCEWLHVMSQSWILSLYPAEIDWVGHIEDLSEGLRDVGRRFGLHRLGDVRRKGGRQGAVRDNLNEGSLDASMLESFRTAHPVLYTRLVDHLSQEYACFGYLPPPAAPKASTAI